MPTPDEDTEALWQAMESLRSGGNRAANYEVLLRVAAEGATPVLRERAIDALVSSGFAIFTSTPDYGTVAVTAG